MARKNRPIRRVRQTPKDARLIAAVIRALSTPDLTPERKNA